MTDNTETLYNALDKVKELEKENTKLKETNNTLYESVMKVGKRNNELKAQVERLEKEKCELLGLIQEKDKLIEKMKCCENCRHYSRTYGHCYSYDSYQNCESLSNWSLDDC